jgi:hypothetical protein
VANFTQQPPSINNSVIIGKSTTNYASNTINYTSGMSAVITGRTGSYLIQNTDFNGYPSGSLFLQTCKLCDDPDFYTNTGTEITVSGLTFSNVNGNMLNMIGNKLDVIYDLDGSFNGQFDGGSRTSGTIIHGWNHIATYNQAACPSAATASTWDNAIYCDQTVTLRRVLFTNLMTPQLFKGQMLKAA